MPAARRQGGPGRRIGLLASRLRREEKAILVALEARGIVAEHLDPRALYVSSDVPWTGPSLVINREIGHFRALYAASSLELAGVTVVNSAAATQVCGDKWH